jgi:hypothetical protein
MAPLIEAGGIIYYIYLISTGQLTLEYAIILFIFVYSFSVMITLIAILWDDLAGMKYSRKRDVLKLCLAAIVEPIAYHPLVLFYSLRGNWFFFTRRKLAWGVMTRIGFKK